MRTDTSSLPINTQPSFIRAALQAGKHVISEKPVAGTISEAEKLTQWYHSNIDSSKATWAVAENYRFLNSITHGSEIASGLGRLLNFGVKMQNLVQGGKYFETEWRKVPEYQGGFVLDGGVHFIAVLRQILGGEKIEYVSAFTRQNQDHLPPLDTVDACVRTKNGATGTISISFGTTLKDNGYTAAFEHGSLSLSSNKATKTTTGKTPVRSMKVVVTKGDTVDEKDIEDEGSGVKPEIRTWAESIVNGKQDPRQSPEQALADLEIVSFEPSST